MKIFFEKFYKINKGEGRSHFYQWFKYINDVDIFYKLKIHAEYYCAENASELSHYIHTANVDLDFKFDKFML